MFTYFEGTNFESFPLGGTLSFSRQLIHSIDEKMNLVGISNNEEPIGEWFFKTINGKTFEFFGICSVAQVEKSIIPARLYTYFALKKHIKKILTKEIKNVFTQTPQFVFVLSHFRFTNFCFLFAGLGNSVALSKYKMLRIFGGIYERNLFHHLLNSATKVLAASDKTSILEKTQKYNLPDNYIIQFPTRFDERIFRPLDKMYCRKKLGIHPKEKIFITVGRLSYIKGWDFLIDSFKIFLDFCPNSKLYFIGSVEDSHKIIKYCSDKLIAQNIVLVGRKDTHTLAKYLNASDVFLMGSITEGWPTAMVEAIACGLPVVSTNVSGAKDMIEESRNGYISEKRDARYFCELLLKSIALPSPNNVSIEKSNRYKLSNLEIDFHKVWLNELL